MGSIKGPQKRMKEAKQGRGISLDKRTNKPWRHGRRSKPTKRIKTSVKSRNELLPLLHLFLDQGHATIVDIICDNLDVQDIVKLNRVCRSLRTFSSNVVSWKWNINRQLSRFVDDASRFRYQLGSTGGLIFGPHCSSSPERSGQILAWMSSFSVARK